MRQLSVIEFVTLDGVMQGLGSPDEDRDGGLAWANAQVLPGELEAGVRALKAEGDGSIAVLGSGVLVQELAALGLVDGYRLFLHPLLLGSGKRLFTEREHPLP